ncbi:DUF484 family protein [Pseudomonas sp. C27(2019)]|uniref:DUF484 family protein n=1 Tax=Pseudomonas sp. C27(2019) TaxID=2604941 RepID=UPI0012490676|nr:DUF484 family protein [Pseudomonas sp. C27(2019)]QEY59672.1 DUF484 family protein [Pseudomonas sp. C27(2019)]
MSNPQQPASITEEQVVAYLKSHPEFFIGQEDLLVQMRIPHARGSSVSLVERQMMVLRDRNTDMHNRLAHLMDVARDNDRLFEKVRRLVLEILDAQSLDELVGVVDDSLRHSFKVPFSALIVFSDKPINVGRSTSLKAAQQQISGVLVGGKAFCGVLRPKQLEFLFGDENAVQIKSAAVVALDYQGIQGVLAVGSNDQQYYSSSIDTLFLTYLADVLARVLAPMLASLQSVK